jgi:hypothetical protein
MSDGDVYNGPMGDYTLHKLLLEQIHIKKDFALQGHALHNLRLREQTDRDYLVGKVRQSVYELETYVLAEKLAHDVVPVYFSYPATWWEAFKLRFYPKWYLDKHPILYTGVTKKVDFKQYALYPSINKVFPDYPKDRIIIQSLTAIEGG